MNLVSPASAPLPGKFTYSAFSEDLDLSPRRTLAEIIALTPEQMARASRLVTSAYAELLQVAASLEDPAYRRLPVTTISTMSGRPFNQLKNYLWSQFGQITLYEILVREGFKAACKTVMRLVAKG